MAPTTDTEKSWFQRKWGSLFPHHETDFIDENDKEIKKLTTELEALSKDYVAGILREICPEPQPFTQYLYSEEGVITKLQERVRRYGTAEELQTLQNSLAQHLLKAVDDIMANKNSDQFYLDRIKKEVLDFANITDVRDRSVSTGLQAALLSRAKGIIQKAAEMKYEHLCQKANSEKATEEDILIAHQFPHSLESIQAFSMLQLEKHLIQHTKIQFTR